MKRWMISACLTLVILFAACLLCTDFSPKKEFYASLDADNSTFVAVMTTVKRKKKSETKTQNQNTIKAPSDVIHSPKKDEILSEKEEEKTDENANEKTAEFAETDENDSTTDADFGLESELASDMHKTGAQIKAEESYKAYALKRIASKKSYPLKARATGLEGSVKLHVVIGLSGELELAEITQPCSHELLNEAALLAVKNSAPFKKKPDTMQKLELNFFMEFKLTG